MSWYQEQPAVALELLATADIDRSSSLIDVGGGTGTLVDALLNDGWSDLTVLDVSDVALAVARERVGTDTAVRWIEHDLLTWQPARPYDVWHDRAVFHFLVEDEDRRRYRHVPRQALAPSGTIIVGTFASDGPTHCSGLPVARHDEAELVAALGDDFDTLGVDTRGAPHSRWGSPTLHLGCAARPLSARPKATALAASRTWRPGAYV